MKSVSDVKLAKIVRRFLALLSNHTHTAADVGALSYTLLWTNSNADQAFAAQTIEIDLSGYDGVKIIHKTSEPTELYRKADGTFPGSWQDTMSWVDTASGTFGFVVRRCGVTDDGIKLENAMQCNCTSSGNQVVQNHNTVLIPVEIYGIKGLPKTN